MKIRMRSFGIFAAVAVVASATPPPNNQERDAVLTGQALKIYQAMVARGRHVSGRISQDWNACRKRVKVVQGAARVTPASSRHLLPIDPEIRAKLQAQDKVNAVALKDIFAGSDLHQRRAKIFRHMDSHIISQDMAADFLVDLCKTDIALGFYAEALQVLAVGGPKASRALEPENEIPLLYLALLTENSNALPGDVAGYIGLKFESTNRFAKDPIAHQLFTRGSKTRSQTAFQTFLLLAGGLGGSGDPDIKRYAAKRALQIQPRNALAIIAYCRSVRPDDPKIMPTAVSVLKSLPAGAIRDELSEILNPGSTHH